jgi:hypothetical protein
MRRILFGSIAKPHLRENRAQRNADGGVMV